MIAGRLTYRFALLALMASLAACARNGPPAPVSVQGTPAGRVGNPTPPVTIGQPAPTLTPGLSAPADVVVRAGESLFQVSRRTSVAMRSLIDVNNLQPPFTLQAGQRLNLPQQRTYQVQSGDTLPGIARRFGLGMNELVRVNAVPPPYALHVGQALVLPTDAANLPPQVVAATRPALPELTQPIAPTIEAAPAVRAPAIESAALPPLTAPSTRPAPSTATPPTITAPPAQSARAPETEDVVAAVPAPSVARPEAIPAPASRAAPTSIPGLPAPRAASPDEGPAPARRGERFLWPVRGPVISDYGNKPGGLQNDGINISAPRGANIQAAEDGVVIYAGNELKGYGNLLLIRHKDGWVTAYAHAERLLVKRGDEVRRGQSIAQVGNSGGVTVPQLHFEVRKGQRPVNPRDFLGT